MSKRPYAGKEPFGYNPYELEFDEPEEPRQVTPQDSLERVLAPYDDKTKIKLLRSYASYLANKVKALQALEQANTQPTVEIPNSVEAE